MMHDMIGRAQPIRLMFASDLLDTLQRHELNAAWKKIALHAGRRARARPLDKLFDERWRMRTVGFRERNWET